MTTTVGNRLLSLIVAAGFVVAVAACGEADPVSAPSGPTAGVTPATAPEPSVTEPSVTEPSVTEPSITPLDIAPCTPEAMEDVVDAELDPDGTIRGTVKISECQNPYARVSYVPDLPNYETEQVFLRDQQGEWEILTYGTGIDCATDADFRPPELETACVALGLRD